MFLVSTLPKMNGGSGEDRITINGAIFWEYIEAKFYCEMV